MFESRTIDLYPVIYPNHLLSVRQTNQTFMNQTFTQINLTWTLLTENLLGHINCSNWINLLENPTNPSDSNTPSTCARLINVELDLINVELNLMTVFNLDYGPIGLWLCSTALIARNRIMCWFCRWQDSKHWGHFLAILLHHINLHSREEQLKQRRRGLQL